MEDGRPARLARRTGEDARCSIEIKKAARLAAFRNQKLACLVSQYRLRFRLRRSMPVAIGLRQSA